MKLNVKYNSQRDNFNFGGQFSGWKQCFSTCSWMFISYFLNKNPDDKGLAEYVNDIEIKINPNARIAKKAINQFKWISGFTSLWWLVQREGIQDRLQDKKIIYKESIDDDEISSMLRSGSPVIVGTNRLPGLGGGHIIIIVGEDEDDWIVNDPFGDATTAYLQANGSNVKYNKNWLLKYSAVAYGYRTLYAV